MLIFEKSHQENSYRCKLLTICSQNNNWKVQKQLELGQKRITVYIANIKKKHKGQENGGKWNLTVWKQQRFLNFILKWWYRNKSHLSEGVLHNLTGTAKIVWRLLDVLLQSFDLQTALILVMWTPNHDRVVPVHCRAHLLKGSGSSNRELALSHCPSAAEPGSLYSPTSTTLYRLDSTVCFSSDDVIKII